MGRKSLAQIFYDELKKKEETKTDSEVGQWIVIYDFPKIKSRTKFWTNLHRLRSKTGVGGLIQYSVFITPDKKTATSAVKLVQHYDGEVECFKVEEEIDICI